MAALFLVAVLLLSTPSQLERSDVPEPLDQVPVEDPGIEDQVAGAESDVDGGVANATQDAEATTGPDGAGATASGTSDGLVDQDVNASVEASLGRRATAWNFSLPSVQAEQEHLRFIAGDGTLRDDVAIRVVWTDLNGTPQPLPQGDGPALRLHLSRDDETQRIDPSTADEHSATFTIPMTTWVRDGSVAWALEAEATYATTPGLGAMRSPYDRDGPREAAHVHWGEGSVVWVHDSDGDGEPDDRDNCPHDPNPEQADLDQDRAGDVCDDDDDGDGWSDVDEEAAPSDPRDPASTPVDRDGDGFNNTHETEEESDPDDPRSTPHDRDADGHSAAVEAAAGSDDRDPASTPTDPDADGIPNNQDLCPRTFDPAQQDGDGDSIGDACDDRPEDGPDGDHDGDGVRNIDDVCPRHADADQDDLDGDGLGDACEDDTDGDGFVDWDDAFVRDAAEWRDNDGDGLGDNADSDDDNDGLSDGAEAALGTDPLVADSDDDRYDDLDEVRMGTDPLDGFDPPFLPTDAEATAGGDGTRIRWTPADDPRVAAHVVWEPQTRRIVAVTGASVVTDAEANGTGFYAVQPLFHDEEVQLDAGRSVHALAMGAVQERLEAAPARGADAEPAPDDGIAAAPGEDVPLAPWLAVVAIGLVAWRRRGG